MNRENLLKVASLFGPAEVLNKRLSPMHCGSVCCVIGHASAIIPIIDKDKGWSSYAQRVFGISCWSPKWTFLFDSEWARIDNTSHGAAKRIRYFLKHGAPDNYLDQMRGLAPLDYWEEE